MSDVLVRQLAIKIAAIRPELDVGQVTSVAVHLAGRGIGSIDPEGRLYFTEDQAMKAAEMVPGIVTADDIQGDTDAAKIARAHIQAIDYRRAHAAQQTASLDAHHQRVADRAQRIQERCASELPTWSPYGEDNLKCLRATRHAQIIREEMARDGL